MIQRLEEMIQLLHQILGKLSETAAVVSYQKDELLDGVDTMKLLQISQSSLYRLRKNKLLKFKRIAGKYYFFRSSILNYDSDEQEKGVLPPF